MDYLSNFNDDIVFYLKKVFNEVKKYDSDVEKLCSGN